jgi:hypothetical protein
MPLAAKLQTWFSSSQLSMVLRWIETSFAPAQMD